MAVVSVTADAADLQFSDDFASFTSGVTWEAAGNGYPDVANGATVDGSRTVLRMKTSNLSPAQERGIQLVTPVAIPASATTVHVEVNFLCRSGGNSSMLLSLAGARGSLRAFTQDFFPRRVMVDGNGIGGGFSSSSSSGVYNFNTYYTFTVDITSEQTRVALKSDDSSMELWSYTGSNLVMNDLGNTLSLKIMQVSGAGVVENLIDKISVSTSSVPLPTPATWVVNLPSDEWYVRYVRNQSKPMFAMYTSGGLAQGTYPEYVKSMRETLPKGLGDAFDPGPSLGNAADYQYLADQGYPSIAWSPPYLTSPFGGVGNLSPMDQSGVFSAIAFGEWGYHFHTDKPYGSYDGYPVRQTTKLGCYNFLKSAYLEQTATFRHGRANSITGHSHYESYASEWGCLMSGIEVGENIAFTQSKIAFTRGAARQWNLPWSIQMSPWFNGYCTRWNTLDYGHSLSLYSRMLRHGWFAGSAWITPENSYNIIYNTGLPAGGLNAWGTALADLNAFIKARNPGTPYTPVAVVIDHLAGYNGYARKAWGTLPFTTGDWKIDGLFSSQLFPGSDFIHANPFPANPEQGYLRVTPYGEGFDVLLSSVQEKTLKAYPVILLVGDITFDDPLVDVLKMALAGGSKLLMQASHQSALGANFPTLLSAGYVEVLDEWTNPATGRPAAISNSRLEKLAFDTLPIKVSGSPIQYSINRTDAGWAIELIHNSGVVKSPSTAATVVSSDIASVMLKPQFPVSCAYRWRIDSSGNVADVNFDYTEAISVLPGETVYIEFQVADDPYLRWAKTYQMNGPLSNKAEDWDQDGLSNFLEFAANCNPLDRNSLPRQYPSSSTSSGVNSFYYTIATRSGAAFGAAENSQVATVDMAQYTVEASTDLIHWGTVKLSHVPPPTGVSLTGLDPGWEWHTFTLADPLSHPSNCFIRHRIAETK